MIARENTKDPIKISFTDVNYKVRVKSSPQERRLTGQTFKELHILKDCTGVLFPGQTHYIMGASGAGKTSLLNVLSDRIGIKPGDSLTGQITFNDRYRLD
jgi:ABC-type multidrug transport system ATPase subunit